MALRSASLLASDDAVRPRHGHQLAGALPSRSFPANAFGLNDMHGNVWEWCQDVWRDDPSGAPCDGSAWEGAEIFCERVLRGGAWHGVSEGLRCAARNGDVAAARRPWFGFRIARTVTPT
jgi:formylglycine-generating enzyme required for sulfatase activity